MPAHSKASRRVHPVRLAEKPREAIAPKASGVERGSARAAAPQTTSAEAPLRDRYAELRASGLACDRW